MAEAQGTQDPMPRLVSHDLHRTGLRPLGLYDPCFYGGLGCERHSLGSGVLVRHTLFSKDFRVCRNHETIKGQSWVPPGAFPTVHSSQMTQSGMASHGLACHCSGFGKKNGQFGKLTYSVPNLPGIPKSESFGSPSRGASLVTLRVPHLFTQNLAPLSPPSSLGDISRSPEVSLPCDHEQPHCLPH